MYKTFTDHSTHFGNLFVTQNIFHVVPPKITKFIQKNNNAVYFPSQFYGTHLLFLQTI
jgi:hypothetical protein